MVGERFTQRAVRSRAISSGPISDDERIRTFFRMTGSGLGAKDHGELSFTPVPGNTGGAPVDY
jgi:hypothetical protein